MTYKEKKLKELKESYKKAYKDILPEEVLEKGNSWYENFLSSTIDEILGCLPSPRKEYLYLFFKEEYQEDFLKQSYAFNLHRELFLQNLEQKAGEV